MQDHQTWRASRVAKTFKHLYVFFPDAFAKRNCRRTAHSSWAQNSSPTEETQSADRRPRQAMHSSGTTTRLFCKLQFLRDYCHSLGAHTKAFHFHLTSELPVIFPPNGLCWTCLKRVFFSRCFTHKCNNVEKIKLLKMDFAEIFTNTKKTVCIGQRFNKHDFFPTHCGY